MNFEVVLASGEIVNANARENSELWWAVKGGSNNFGVVTAFHFTVFEEADLWGGMVAYDASEFPGQLEALYEFAHHAAHDELTQVMACMGLFGGHMTCLNLLYRTDAKPKPESLRPFFEVGKQYEGHSTLRIGSHKDFVDEIGKTNPIGYRYVAEHLLQRLAQSVSRVPLVKLSFYPLQSTDSNVIGIGSST